MSSYVTGKFRRAGKQYMCIDIILDFSIVDLCTYLIASSGSSLSQSLLSQTMDPTMATGPAFQPTRRKRLARAAFSN